MLNNNTTNTNQINQYSSYIQILGKHPQAVSILQYPYPYLPLISNPSVYCPQLENKPQITTLQPKKIFVQGNMIAIIDYYDNLWLISQIFPFQVNVSAMLSRKIKNFYLGQGQCIFNSKKTPIILNWGAKKIIDTSSFQTLNFNQKYFKNANNFFTAFQISNTHREDKYFYSNIKKIDNSNKLYQICTNSKEEIIEKKQNNLNKKNKTHKKQRSQTIQKQEIYSIIAYPTLQTNFMRNKVVGLSIGKVHCMCWDTHGILYTWGNRTIALGYPQLPIQKTSTKPKRVSGLNKYVTMGFAATHYSLALTSDGHLYEWGIKKTTNSINEQLIFQPQILQNGLNESKIIVLKGKLDLFGCLSSKHELFLWGEKSAKFLPFEVQQSLQNKNGYIYQPYRIPYLQNQYVVDFGIGDQFISLIVANSGVFVSSQQQIYWNDMIKRVKIKLKFGNNIKTQTNETLRENYSPLNFRQSNCLEQKKIPIELANVSSEPFQSKIQKAYEQRKLKKQYFKSLRNQEKLFINLLKTKKQNPTNEDKITHKIASTNRFLSQRIDLEQKILSSRTKKHIKQNHITKLIPCLQKKNFGFLESSQLAVLSAKKFIRDNFSQTLKQVMPKKTPRQYQPFTIKSKANQFYNSKLKTETYQARLEKVQKRKKSLQQNYIEEVSNKIKQNSIQFRSKRHQEIMEAKNREKHKNSLKNTLVAFLIKNYIIKMVKTPLEQARKVKIQQFAKGLHVSRIQRNLRLIFIKTRVKCGLKKLRKLNFLTYALLCTVFKRYIKKVRQQKNKLMRKIVAQQLYKNVLKQKIRFGIAKTNLNIKKIQKFGQWLKMVKNERIKCLKILWKNYLLTTMRVINEADSMAICKAQQNCTFESLYKQRIAQNPMLSLETFLKKSPIFQIRFEYFHSIIYLFRNENKAKSEKLLKSMKLIRRKNKIKFNGQGQFATLTTGIQSSPDLLPYSLHFNLLIRPKSLDLNIPQCMKKSERWIRQEAIVFQKCLNKILEQHEKNFLKAKRQYDIDLAYFIREKYDTLAQKRWKSIIEYNKIKITPYKKKREKQLYRIFGLIGMQRILNEDFLPQKYLMLQQAIKKRDAPTPPSSFIAFDINSFKDIFKKYHDTISLKAKYFRKNYI